MKYKIPRHLVFLKNAPAWSWAFSRQLLALLVMFSMTPWVLATVNPDPGDDDDPDCEGESGGSGGGHSSYSWYLNVGYAPKSRPTNLNTLASLGSNVHGRPTSFQKRFDDSFSSDPLQRSQVKVLIQQTQFSAALFHPSCVFFDSMMSDFEKIDKPASGGFPAFVHQIVTDDCFTLIDTLPASEGSGWRARVWKKNLAALNKVGTFYDATPFFAHPPLTDITFKRPSATAGDNTLLYLEKQNTGSSIRTITEEAVQVLAGDGKRASLVSKIFLGDGTAGPLLSQENLTYSARGTKLWDYSITREVLESSVTGAGTIGGLTLVKKSFEDYDDFSLSPPTGGARGMKRLMTRIDAFQVPGQLPQTTTYQYVNSPTNAATHGLITSRVNPDGSWKYHEYPLYSATSSVIQAIDYEGWKDVTMANRAQARITTHETLGTNSTSTTRIGGQLIAQKKVTVATQALAGAGSVFNFATGSQAPPLFPIAAEEHFDGSAFHITTTLYYPDSAPFPHKSRIAWVENSDGTAVTYTYATVNNNLVVTMREGAGNRNGVTAGIETQTTYSSGNHPIAEIQKDIASNLTVYTWDTDFSYNGGTDALGRPIKRIFNGDVNDFAIAQYACCGLAFARQRDGSSEEYFRDGLKRVYKVVSKATAASPEVTNFIAINGLTTTRTRNFGGSSSLFLSSSTESIDGLTSSQTLPAEKSNLAADRPTTSSVIVRGAGSTGDTITTTFADGSKSIKSHFLDGQPKSSTGTAVPDVSYDYSAHNDGFGGLRTITTASGVVTTTFEDLLGRKTKVLSTEFGAGEIKYEYFPHVNSAPAGSRTKLMSVTDPDGVVISFAYNSKGERITESRIVPLASGSSTQVSSYAIDYVPNITIHGYNLGVSRVESQSLSGTGTAAVTLRQNYTSTDGLSRGSTSLTGNSLTVVTRPNGSGVRTSTTTRPDGTKDVKTFTHGLLTKQSHLSTTSTVLTEISYLYSPQQQLTGTTDARTGTTTFDWNSDNIPDLAESGKPLGQKNPDGTNLQFSYDVLGRLIRTVNPDSSVTHIAYYPTGLQKARWGSQTNPQWYQYDEQGRMTHLYTWQVAPTLDPASLPASAPAGSTATQWVYQPSSGRLQRKQYADGNGTDYTYTDAGRLKTRTWARTLPSSTTRVNTTYHYTHGFLTLTDYNDNTPDVTMAYDALGRTQTVTQAAQSQITYTYAADFNVDLETIRYDLNADGTYNDFVRVIDRNDFSLGRDTGFKLLAGTTIEHEALYTYHPLDGRLQQVSNPQIPGHQFNYTYEPNSNLLDTINGPVHQVDNTWETNRDVLDIKQNQVASTVISRYDYSVNAIGQRTALAQTGTAFTGPKTIAWNYDSLGQVTLADVNGMGDRAYEYDAIGNRKKSAHNTLTLPATDNYTSNALNQYTTVPGHTGAIVHDPDGNLTQGSTAATSNLVWDAENRLISATNSSSGQTTTYRYDAFSRRITRSVGVSPTTIFIYDAWNCITEYQFHHSSFNLHTSYLWGMDLSGTMQGVGGVGGLLAVRSGAATHFPTYDGNGNITQYLTATGTIAAHFEYDPFGNTVVNTDTTNQFAYRFSTKPLDQPTGFYYYGYRYYDPTTGRWPSRDPIEEKGGINLYGFLYNSPISYVDLLGQTWFGTASKWMSGAAFGMALGAAAAGSPLAVPLGLSAIFWGLAALADQLIDPNDGNWDPEPATDPSVADNDGDSYTTSQSTTNNGGDPDDNDPCIPDEQSITCCMQ